MSAHKLHLEGVDIGGGVIATDAWVSGSPIVLIETMMKGNPDRKSRIKSRLDLQKQMFIDPLPGDRTATGIGALVKAVVEAGLRRPEPAR